MASRNKSVKLIRGAGTVNLFNTLHTIRDRKRRPLLYKADNEEGTIMAKPDYAITKTIPSPTTDNPDRTMDVRVRWDAHTFAGLNGFITDWKQYPANVVAGINDLRSGDLMEVLNAAIEHYKVLVSATTYSVYRDSHVKVYHYNGDESPRHHEANPDDPLSKDKVTYNNIRMGYMASWKQTSVLDASEAQEIKQWLKKSKLTMDLLMAQASMGEAKLAYTRGVAQSEQLEKKLLTYTEQYMDYERHYVAHQAKYDKVVLWLSECPMDMSEHGMNDTLRRFYKRSPKQMMAAYKHDMDMCAKRLKTVDESLEAYEGMGWGEEE